MLLNLHVKNLALIEETDVEFGEGLNILTGETGAGKSILLGSINLALGAKFDKEMLRKGADSALVELTFSCSEDVADKLREMDLEVEDTVTISRRLAPGKTVSKINGETVNIKQIKELAELLIDIHGQHEHQSLLNKKKHLEILDSFCTAEGKDALDKVTSLYHEVRSIKQKIKEESLDEDSKNREQDLLEFEVNEISNARLIIGEDDELEKNYRRMVNGKKITASLSECYGYTGAMGDNDAASLLGRAIRSINSVSEYDPQIEQLEETLAQVEDMLSDFNHEIAAYLSDMEFDERDFRETEDRLNEINRLKDKYGYSLEKVLEAYEQKQKRLEMLADYDIYMAEMEKQLSLKEKQLENACGILSAIRMKNAAVLEKQLTDSLMNLNFLAVQFAISITPMDAVSAKGIDDVEFKISTNPGEPMKSLAQVASGGELSRIMLAIKTVLAAKDAVDTLIFDEIDAGISGRTAWKVSEQLDVAAKAHQVICITHLPQIAAMADKHYLIEKSGDDNGTVTQIRELLQEENLLELARLLGGDDLTEAAVANARNMREQAMDYKKVHF